MNEVALKSIHRELDSLFQECDLKGVHLDKTLTKWILTGLEAQFDPSKEIEAHLRGIILDVSRAEVQMSKKMHDCESCKENERLLGNLRVHLKWVLKEMQDAKNKSEATREND